MFQSEKFLVIKGHDFTIEVTNLLRSVGYTLMSTRCQSVRDCITFVDEKGYKYTSTLERLKCGKAPLRYNPRNEYVIENIKNFINLNGLNITILSSTYDNMKGLLSFRCGCGFLFDCSLDKLINRNRKQCPKCAKALGGEKRRIDIVDAYRLFIKNGYTPLFPSYKSAKDRLLCMDSNGYLGLVSYHNLKSGNGFDMVSKYNPYTLNNISHFIACTGATCELMSDEYSNARTLLEFRCSCGNIYRCSWRSFMSQKVFRCPTCAKSQSSYEVTVENAIKEMGYNYHKEYRFNDCKDKSYLFFDFALFVGGSVILIEVDGEGHYQPIWSGKKGLQHQQRRDDIKTNYCRENHHILIRVPYWEIKSLNFKELLEKKIRSATG